MREMVFNHASATLQEVKQTEVVEWIRGVVGGMAQLVGEGVVGSTLRLGRELHDIQCLPDLSLWSAIDLLQKYGHKDDYLFFLRLSAKSPLLNEVSEELVSRFKGCEDLTLPAPDGGPLVFCAISDGISVSFPSATIWDADRVKVRFLEIREDGEIEEVEEEIDNLSCSQHAFSINDRHQSRPKDIVDPRELWERRAELFPNLLFGSDVRSNFMTSASLLGTIVGKLSALDRTAKDWRVRGGGMPEWRTLVSPESNTKMKNKKFQSSRTFRSHNGEQEIFEWHARFGDSGRIHLRFDTEEREIEIGYIGSHLPN